MVGLAAGRLLARDAWRRTDKILAAAGTTRGRRRCGVENRED
jgi:hypothetical protein